MFIYLHSIVIMLIFAYTIKGNTNNKKIKAMKLNVRKKETRFMNGNIDIDGYILDILIEAYGQLSVLSSNFDTDNAIYSDGFIKAIEAGKIPTLELMPTNSYLYHNVLTEYHHVIINDECYNVFFK